MARTIQTISGFALVACCSLAVAAEDDPTYAIYGRAGAPAGSDRHAFVTQVARPAAFDTQVQFEAGHGRAGGPAAMVLERQITSAALREARTRGTRQQMAESFGRAGYVPGFPR